MHQGCKDSIQCRYATLQQARESGGFEPIAVATRIVVFTVNEIDTATQGFVIDYQLELSWSDPEFVSFAQTDAWQTRSDADGFQAAMQATCWHPNLVCINQREVMRREVWWRLDVVDQIVTMCCEHS